VTQGESAYREFLAWSATPGILLVNLVTFAGLLYHAVTFFAAAPQAMAVHLGGRRVPGRLVLAGHYAAWLAASVVISWFLLGAS
jgi:fumarate reductase subunit C